MVPRLTGDAAAPTGPAAPPTVGPSRPQAALSGSPRAVPSEPDEPTATVPVVTEPMTEPMAVPVSANVTAADEEPAEPGIMSEEEVIRRLEKNLTIKDHKGFKAHLSKQSRRDERKTWRKLFKLHKERKNIKFLNEAAHQGLRDEIWMLSSRYLMPIHRAVYYDEDHKTVVVSLEVVNALREFDHLVRSIHVNDESEVDLVRQPFFPVTYTTADDEDGDYPFGGGL